MDSAQKIKFTTKALSLANTPEKRTLIRELFCGQPETLPSSIPTLPSESKSKLWEFWNSTPVWGAISAVLAIYASTVSVKFTYSLVWIALCGEFIRLAIGKTRPTRYAINAAFSMAMGVVMIIGWPLLPKPKEEPNLDQKLAVFSNDLVERINARVSGSSPGDVASDLPVMGFQDDSDFVSVTFGPEDTGANHIAMLKQMNRPVFPVTVDDFSPVSFQWDKEKNRVSYTITFWSPDNHAPIQVKDGQFVVRNVYLDRNFTRTAFEVVTKNGQPVLQVIWQTPGHMILNGLFPRKDGALLCMAANMPTVVSAPSGCNIKPIFKYPSWKYPGVLAIMLP